MKVYLILLILCFVLASRFSNAQDLPPDDGGVTPSEIQDAISFDKDPTLEKISKRANRPAVDVEQSQCKIAPSFFLQERGLYLDRSSSVRVS